MKTFLLKNSLTFSLMIVVALFTTKTINAQSGTTTSADIEEIPELVFRNPKLTGGTAGKEGAVYLFKDVAKGFDATIKLKKFSDKNIYMKNIDNTDFGWDKAFQPEFGMQTVLPNQKWYIDFELTFFEAGTTKKKKADRFTVTALDVDGDNSNVKEFVVMEKASSTVYSTISYLNGTASSTLQTCCECGGQSAVETCGKCNGTGLEGKTKKCPKCDGVGKIYSVCKHPFCGADETVQGPVNNFNNIDTAATNVMATSVYNNKDEVTFQIGATSGNRSGGAGVRLNSLWFRAFSLQPPVVLPVKIDAFNASYDQKNINLNWNTSFEQNFSHFEIERSTDGKSYSSIATVFCQNEINANSNYSYKDKEVQTSTGVVYYRLKSVDKTGEISYSKVNVVRLSASEAKKLAIETYPNPVVNQVKVSIPGEWQGKTAKIEVINSNGVRVQSAEFNNINQTASIDLSGLAKGFYVIKASNGMEKAEQRIIKN